MLTADIGSIILTLTSSHLLQISFGYISIERERFKTKTEATGCNYRLLNTVPKSSVIGISTLRACLRNESNSFRENRRAFRECIEFPKLLLVRRVSVLLASPEARRDMTILSKTLYTTYDRYSMNLFNSVRKFDLSHVHEKDGARFVI
jgi:hypothetical protein